MGFFLFLFLFIAVLALAVVGSVLNIFVRLFSFGRKGRASQQHQQSQDPASARSAKKVFSREEGEYVDYEEVKE